MPIPNLETIGEWSPTELARFIQQTLVNNPAPLPPSLDLESLNVGGTAQIGGDLIVGGNIQSDTGITLPTAIVGRDSNQNISTSAWENISFTDRVFYNSNDIFPKLGPTGGLVFFTSGLYLIGGQIEFAGNTTGRRHIRIISSGSVQLAEISYLANGSGPTGMDIVTIQQLTGSSTTAWHLQCWQNSGGVLATTGNVRFSNRMWAVKLV